MTAKDVKRVVPCDAPFFNVYLDADCLYRRIGPFSNTMFTRRVNNGYRWYAKTKFYTCIYLCRLL